MRRLIFLTITLAFGAYATALSASESLYKAFHAGMSPEQVTQTIIDRGGEKPIFDNLDERYSSIYGAMPSALPLPQATGWFLFDDKRLTAAMFEYIVRPHGTSPDEIKATCDADFARIRADVESAFGPPTAATEEKVGDLQRTRLKWQSSNRFKLTSQYVNDDNCGSIRTLLFDGTEAEFMKRARIKAK